jgi:hypothetical protein
MYSQDSQDRGIASPTSGTETKYTSKDLETMKTALAHFFKNENGDVRQPDLYVAETTYQRAVQKPGASPLEAFKQVAMATQHGQEMDKLHAHRGGLIYYVMNASQPGTKCDFPEKISRGFRAECLRARVYRKVEDIKETMEKNEAKEKKKKRNLSPPGTFMAPEPAGVQLEADAAAAAASADYTCGSKEEEAEEADDDGLAKTTSEMALDNEWVVIDDDQDFEIL